MDYRTYQPSQELESLVKFYWTLEVPFDPKNKKQQLIPDGCIEMTFNFGDGIKRYVSENDYIVHPWAMVMGQRTESYYIEPLGDVESFAICFYPHGFTNFVSLPLKDLVDKEVPLEDLFGSDEATDLEQRVLNAGGTSERIEIIESFLLKKLHENSTIENIVKTVVDELMSTNGGTAIKEILKGDLSKRRQLERNFKKQIGISPKQLGRVVRLQAALKTMLNNKDSLTNVAYESDYFDQAHFIRDFKKFLGMTPKEFLGNENMVLSSIFYK